jgi:hypothetical protein
MANEAGLDPLRKPKDDPAVRRDLETAGYRGEKIVLLVPTDYVTIKPILFTDIPQMAGSFAGSERTVAIARASRQRSCRSERCRRLSRRAMMGNTARLRRQNPSFGRTSPAGLQAGRLRC